MAPRATPGFTLRLHRPQPPAEVWRRLWDLTRHTREIPFTVVTSDDGEPLRHGSRFVGRTGVGPLRLDDRMVVREWDPPRRAVVEKVGPVLRGRITVTLDGHDGGTALTWRQELGARGVPDRLAAAVAPLVRRGYRAALVRILG